MSLAGELATFTESRKRPVVFPPYRHDDLNATFRPVMAAIRQALSAVLEQTAVSIALQERKFGIRVGPILDRSLTTDATWVLAVKAQVPGETAAAQPSPTRVKIGPVENNPRADQRGVAGDRRAGAARWRRGSCRTMPALTYFELDRSGPYWAALARSGGIAIHVTGDVPGGWR